MTTDKQLIDRVEQGFAGSCAAFDTDGRLHGRFAALAERRGLLDVSYRTIDSPLEPLLLAATGKGLVRVAFSREDHQSVLSRLASDISPRILRTPAARRCGAPARGVLRRQATHVTVPVDLRLAHGFRRSVLLHLRDIPYGETQSYTAVARAAGNPSAVRAAASACSTIRCHWSCPAIASCAAMAPWASTSAGPRPSTPCSRWRRQGDLEVVRQFPQRMGLTVSGNGRGMGTSNSSSPLVVLSVSSLLISEPWVAMNRAA